MDQSRASTGTPRKSIFAHNFLGIGRLIYMQINLYSIFYHFNS